MTPISLTVNGQTVQALVEPRMHLGDFLREHCRLTGTHLGCEHGVCGACTVLIADAPARSCIAYAVACDGLAIRTIEGFDDDATMAELREAFSREHALQCGFCTPGMLIAARDIAERMPDADERRIRVELSGNLCRCTGYRGIVNAVRSVVEARRQQPAVPCQSRRRAGCAACRVRAERAEASPLLRRSHNGSRRAAPRLDSFEESFVILKPPSTVWNTFADIPAVAACLPGAALTEYDLHTVKGKMSVKLGPISAAFAGSAVIERDDAALRGVIRGAGSDRGTGSRTKGEVTYRLSRRTTASRRGCSCRSNTACKARSRNSRAPGLRRTSAAVWLPISPPISMPASRGNHQIDSRAPNSMSDVFCVYGSEIVCGA